MASISENKGHATDILKGLNSLRENDNFCDAVLQASDGQKFPVHRVVLSAANQYFKTMFSGSFKEARENTGDPIVLENVTSSCLSSVLGYTYSGKLKLTNKNVKDVLSGAHMMQLLDVVDACVDHLKKRISTVTCFQTLKTAETYDLTEVYKNAENFILSKFPSLSKNNDFNEMSVTKMCKYLADDRLQGEEIDIFRNVKQWLAYEEDHKQHLVQVMSLINFKAIPLDTLACDVMPDEDIKLDAECFQMVIEAVKYHSDVFKQPLDETFKPRGEETIVVIDTGDTVDGQVYTGKEPTAMYTCRKSDIFSDETVEWNKSALTCSLARVSVNLVRVRNFIYLFGIECETFTLVTKRFDGTTKLWMDLAPASKHGTVGSTAEYINGRIIIIGGRVKSKIASLQPQERLD